MQNALPRLQRSLGNNSDPELFRCIANEGLPLPPGYVSDLPRTGGVPRAHCLPDIWIGEILTSRGSGLRDASGYDSTLRSARC
jgi:hypothetical protein